VTNCCFLFPGQGAQHIGMGKIIAEQYPAAKELFDRANAVLGFDLAEVCWNGPKEKLDATNISQPALFVSSLAALEKLKAENAQAVEQCTVAAGLSLGEYTALTFAGAMSFEDGLKVVKVRGEEMQKAAEATPSGMVSLLLIEIPQIEQIVAQASEVGQIRIANYLCPGNTVVSGEKSACMKAAELAEQAGAKVAHLAVAGAFHTPIMKPADEALAKVLASVTIKPPRIPVYSNVDAKPHDNPDEIRNILVNQVLQPVRWEDSMRSILGLGIEEFYEIGPGKVLTSLMKRIERKKARCTPVNDTPV
jgi:[acyl-carrier-protein] S-malonyltransferase